MPDVNLSTIDDCWVDFGRPANNFDGNGYLIVGEQYAASPDPHGVGVCRSWLLFDLSSIPSGAVITSALLRIYVFFSVDDYADETYNVQRCTDISWTEETITANNAPDGSMTGSTVDFVVNSDGGDGIGTKYLNVKDMVQAALSSGKLSIRIKSAQENGKGINLTETEQGNAGLIPQLQISYRRRSATKVLVD